MSVEGRMEGKKVNMDHFGLAEWKVEKMPHDFLKKSETPISHWHQARWPLWESGRSFLFGLPDFSSPLAIFQLTFSPCSTCRLFKWKLSWRYMPLRICHKSCYVLWVAIFFKFYNKTVQCMIHLISILQMRRLPLRALIYTEIKWHCYFSRPYVLETFITFETHRRKFFKNFLGSTFYFSS